MKPAGESLVLKGEAVHPASLPEEELVRECDVRRLRRSGPGGQHRNKVETAVALKHRPTGIEAEANERRSQSENRQAALHRLRVHLALDVRREIETEAPPSPLWRSRCHAGRLAVNPAHPDFPMLLAEALDVLNGVDMNVAAAAERLRCSTSQLTKFLKLEPRALERVNARRSELGLRRLR